MSKAQVLENFRIVKAIIPHKGDIHLEDQPKTLWKPPRNFQYVIRMTMDDEVTNRMVEVPEVFAIDDNPSFALEPDDVPCHPENVFPIIQPPIKG